MQDRRHASVVKCLRVGDEACVLIKGRKGLTTSANLFGIVIGLVAYGSRTPLPFKLQAEGVRIASKGKRHNMARTHFPAGHFPDSVWMFLDVFLPPAPRVPRAYEFGVILEAWWNGFAAVSVAFDELDHLSFLLLLTPCVKSLEIWEYEGITVFVIARTIRSFNDRSGTGRVGRGW